MNCDLNATEAVKYLYASPSFNSPVNGQLFKRLSQPKQYPKLMESKTAKRYEARLDDDKGGNLYSLALESVDGIKCK